MASPELPSSAFAHGPESGEAGLGLGVPDRGVPGEAAGDLSDLTGAEHFVTPAQNPPDGLRSTASDIKEARRAVWEATGYVPPIAGGTPDDPPELKFQKSGRFKIDWHSEEEREEHNRQATEFVRNQETGMVIWGNPDFNWGEELSPQGQELYRFLLAGRGRPDWLEEFAHENNFDLHKTLAELKGHGLLDERDPRLTLLISKRVGNKK